MPKSSSIADFVSGCEILLATVGENQDLVPLVEAPLQTVRSVLEEVKAVIAAQNAHRAGLRGETKRLRGLRLTAEDATRQVRSILRGHLGPRNEKLAEFGVYVIGRSRTRPANTPPPEPPAPQPAAGSLP